MAAELHIVVSFVSANYTETGSYLIADAGEAVPVVVDADPVTAQLLVGPT